MTGCHDCAKCETESCPIGRFEDPEGRRRCFAQMRETGRCEAWEQEDPC